MKSSFLKAGHTPTLFAAFLYFDLSFMVWVMLGPLGVQIATDLHLSAAQKGLMVATLVLAGALLRIVMGVMVDHLKPKMAGTIGQVIVILALLSAWFVGVENYGQVLALGLALGVAGASFAAALPLASRWYPPEHQGTALGIAGYFTAACVFAGSMVRPIGGMVADRVGGIKSLSLTYILAAALLGVVSFGLPRAWMALTVFMLAMLALGMGNGAVFQLVPQRFRREIGVMTGLVGMAGGVGSFYLASSLGYSKQLTGAYQTGFLIFAGLALLALTGLTTVKSRWRTTWGAAHMTTARV